MLLQEQLAKCDLCNGSEDTLPGMDSQGYNGDVCPKCVETVAKWLIFHAGSKPLAHVIIEEI